MASPIQCIVEGQLLPAAAASLYVSPTGTYSQIVKLTCVNTDTASRTVTIYLVPSGGSTGPANVTTSAQSLLPGQSFNSPNEYAQVLNPGDAIWAFADMVGKVNIRASAMLAS